MYKKNIQKYFLRSYNYLCFHTIIYNKLYIEIIKFFLTGEHNHSANENGFVLFVSNPDFDLLNSFLLNISIKVSEFV